MRWEELMQGRVKEKTVREKASTLRNTLLPCLQSVGVSNTIQINNTTFRAFDQHLQGKYCADASKRKSQGEGVGD